MKKTTSFHLEQDILSEIEEYKKVHNLSSRNIALETISLLKGLPIRLHIIGDGSDIEINHYKAMAHSLLIDDMCVWHGRVPHNQVFSLMSSSHLLFFTSVSEATSSVIFEAMQCGLPVLCFNTCGFGAVVNDRIGLKIELSEPHTSAREFAGVIKSLCDNFTFP